MPISKIKTSSITADAASINLNIDANTLFLDVANNRVGVNNTSPTTALDVTGSVTISGTTPRLLSNMSGTQTTRLGIQNSTTNGNTRFYLYPNGTGNISAINMWNNSDPAATNYSSLDVGIIGTSDIRFSSSSSGSASYLPMTWHQSGSEAMRLDVNGRLGIGTTSPLSIFDVVVGASGARRLLFNYDDSVITIKGSNATPNPEPLRFVADNFRFNTGTTGSGAETMRLDLGGNLLATGGFIPSNTSRLVVRGFSPASYNNTFSQSNSTVQIISNEMNNDVWNPTLNIAMIRQSLTTGKDSFGGIGFSTIDDSNNAGMHDAGRIAIVNDQPSSVASGTAMAFYTQVGSATQTNAANERMRINSAGQVMVGIATATPNTLFTVNEGSRLGGVYVGMVKNTTNTGTGAVILHRLAQGQGFQFSGSIVANSYTGQAYINVMIVAYFTNDAINYQVLNTSSVGGASGKIVLQLATVSYAGGSYLAITKNGGGSGDMYVNGVCQNNIGYPFEVTSGNYSVTTTHGTLN